MADVDTQQAKQRSAEDAAVAAFDEALAPYPRYPVAAAQPSIFGPPNPDSFPGA